MLVSTSRFTVLESQSNDVEMFSLLMSDIHSEQIQRSFGVNLRNIPEDSIRLPVPGPVV